MPEKIKDSIEQIRKGDRNAFRTIVEEHQQYAFRLAFRIIQNEEEARDIVQESFVKIWQHILSYDKRQKFTTWMYKIVTNCAIDRHRKNNRMKLTDLDQEKLGIEFIGNDDPGKELDNIELAKMIRYLSKGLPEKQKLVFILKDLQGFDSDEIGYMLAMNTNAVKSNLYMARKQIAKKLKMVTA